MPIEIVLAANNGSPPTPQRGINAAASRSSPSRARITQPAASHGSKPEIDLTVIDGSENHSNARSGKKRIRLKTSRGPTYVGFCYENRQASAHARRLPAAIFPFSNARTNPDISNYTTERCLELGVPTIQRNRERREQQITSRAIGRKPGHLFALERLDSFPKRAFYRRLRQ